MVSISKAGFNASYINVSNPNVLIYPEYGLFALDASGNNLGFFNFRNQGNTNFGGPVYVDNDVIITGEGDGVKYEISLKKGWNMWYMIFTQSGMTWRPSGMGWYFEID